MALKPSPPSRAGNELVLVIFLLCSFSWLPNRQGDRLLIFEPPPPSPSLFKFDIYIFYILLFLLKTVYWAPKSIIIKVDKQINDGFYLRFSSSSFNLIAHGDIFLVYRMFLKHRTVGLENRRSFFY